MTLMKRYVLRLFISLKYITANVVDINNGRIVAKTSTLEHTLKEALECGHSCNAKVAAAVGEVLAMRLKVEGLDHGEGRGIHADVEKEMQKKASRAKPRSGQSSIPLRTMGFHLFSLFTVGFTLGAAAVALSFTLGSAVVGFIWETSTTSFILRAAVASFFSFAALLANKTNQVLKERSQSSNGRQSGNSPEGSNHIDSKIY